MKADIATYIDKCLTCAKVKAEHMKPSGLCFQATNFLNGNGEKFMDFANLYWTSKKPPSGFDSIWVIVDRMTNSSLFTLKKIRCDSLFTSRFWVSTKGIGDSLDYRRLPPRNGSLWAKQRGLYLKH
ncbi:hypothetical protein Tco_1293728 [Tanacetum coccineum]